MKKEEGRREKKEDRRMWKEERRKRAEVSSFDADGLKGPSVIHASPSPHGGARNTFTQVRFFETGKAVFRKNERQSAKQIEL